MADTLTLKKQNPTTGSATVSVASKLPWPLQLQLYSVKTLSEEVHGTRREYKQSFLRNDSPVIIVAGNSYNKNMGDNGKHIEGGFAITSGVPKDFWEEWLHQNKEGEYIKNGLVFAHEEFASIKAETNDKSRLKTGIERLDQNNLPKINGKAIETGQS